MQKRIGIYSGSFNPIHSGHEMLAKHLSQFSGLDELWLLVTPQNPLKQKSELLSDVHRLAMVKLVANKFQRVVASDFELSLPQPTYTYTTLCQLKETFPTYQFILIIGSDNWLIFDKWKDSEKIINEFGVLIYPRPEYKIDDSKLPQNVKSLADVPVMEISSTDIRNAIKTGVDTRKMLSREIEEYITENNLYR